MHTHWPKPEIKGRLVTKKLKCMTKTVTYMAMYGASKRKAKKLARAANPRMPARKVAKIVNLVFGNWSVK